MRLSSRRRPLFNTRTSTPTAQTTTAPRTLQQQKSSSCPCVSAPLVFVVVWNVVLSPGLGGRFFLRVVCVLFVCPRANSCSVSYKTTKSLAAHLDRLHNASQEVGFASCCLSWSGAAGRVLLRHTTAAAAVATTTTTTDEHASLTGGSFAFLGNRLEKGFAPGRAAYPRPRKAAHGLGACVSSLHPSLPW